MEQAIKIILAFIFGVLPSLVWLFFYLKKDKNPEPKKEIIRIFLWGVVITLPVFVIQIPLAFLLEKLSLASLLISIIYWFGVISLTEEFLKFLVVKVKTLRSPHLDEPTDFVIYMVVVALGFAAMENILYLIPWREEGILTFYNITQFTFFRSFLRFIGATFLHSLCSAIIGYAMAISYCEGKNINFKIGGGLTIATILHGIYDFSIIELNGALQIIVPLAVLISLAIFIFLSFEKLKKIKSVCQLNYPSKSFANSEKKSLY